MKCLLVLLIAIPLCAQEAEIPVKRATLMSSANGIRSWPVGILAEAVGFHLTIPQQSVALFARLGNGGGHAYIDAYLMKETIGPEATEADEVASTTFDLTYPHDGWVSIFENLDLERGTYWLVLVKPTERAHSSINWFVTEPKGYATACGVYFAGTRTFTFYGDAAEYLPASKFEKKYEPYAFQLEVTAAEIPCDAR